MLDETIRMVPQILNTLSWPRSSRAGRSGTTARSRCPDEVIDRVAKELDIGRWIMRFAIYGDEAVVDLKFKKVKEAFERIEGAEVTGTKYGADEYDKIEHPAERVEVGHPEPRHQRA